MKTKELIYGFMLTAILGLSGWTLNEVVSQGKEIAAIKATLNLRTAQSTTTTKTTTTE